MDFLSMLWSFATTATTLGTEFLSEAGKKALSEQVIITAIILWSLRGHFKDVRNGLGDVRKEMAEGMSKLTNSISELASALVKVETSLANRIGDLESRVSKLEKPTKE